MQGGAAGGDDAAVAESMQVLERMQAETGGVAPAADRPAIELCSDRLGRILDDREPMTSGDFEDLRHPRRPAGQVDRKDSPCPGSDGGRELVRVHVQIRADIDKDRFGSGMGDGGCGGDEGIRDRDDFIARLQAEAAQAEMQRIGTAGNSSGQRGVAQAREFLLECLHLRSEDIVAAAQYVLVGADQLATDRGSLIGQGTVRDFVNGRHDCLPS